MAISSALSHRLRLALTTLAVVLGVTFVAGTFVYTDTLHDVFSSMVDEETQGVDVFVEPKVEFETLMDYGVGGPGLAESVVADVAALEGVAAAEGSVTGYAQFVDENGDAITPIGPPTLGISWTTNPELSTLRIESGRPPAGGGEVAMDADTAERYGFAVGDEVDVLLQGPERSFALVGIFDRPSGGGFAGATMAAFDLETAQHVLGKGKKVDQIGIAAAEGVSPDALRTTIAESLGNDVTVTTGVDQAVQTKQQIQEGFAFFTTILLTFAAISLFVGAFIIFNTFSIIVAQRMREFGLLRAIGASTAQVQRLVLIEAFIVGVVASVVGLFLGLGAAVGLQKLMDAVGVDLPTAALRLAPRTIVASFAVGIGVTVLSAVMPARRAGRLAPIAAMQELSSNESALRRRRLYVGTGMAVAGAGLIAAGLTSSVSQELAAVGSGALLLFLGVAILGPVFARPLAGTLARPLPRLFGVPGRLARENSRRSPRRTAATAAAMMVGLALVTLVAMFAASMKGSIDAAMAKTMKADLVVMPQSFASTTGFTPRIASTLRHLPEVGVVSQMRYGEWEGTDGARRTVVGIDPKTVDAVMDLDMLSGSTAALEDGGLLIRDVEAQERGVGVGDQIAMTFSTTGRQQVEIDGVFAAQIDDRYMLSMKTFDANFTRRQDVQVHLVGAAGVSEAALHEAVDGALAAFPNVRVLDQAELRAASSQMIDQMLNMVYGLLGLALLIAVLGITNTLALSVHERRREVGLLRAVGATKAQVRRMFRWEAVVIALFGTVMGVMLGTGLGWAFITALKDEGFSAIVVPLAQIGIFIVVAALAGVAAAVAPARRAAKLDVLEAIAFE